MDTCLSRVEGEDKEQIPELWKQVFKGLWGRSKGGDIILITLEARHEGVSTCL
jgi:hypothetical protein